jgi:hypothetical protein
MEEFTKLSNIDLKIGGIYTRVNGTRVEIIPKEDWLPRYKNYHDGEYFVGVAIYSTGQRNYRDWQTYTNNGICFGKWAGYKSPFNINGIVSEPEITKEKNVSKLGKDVVVGGIYEKENGSHWKIVDPQEIDRQDEAKKNPDKAFGVYVNKDGDVHKWSIDRFKKNGEIWNGAHGHDLVKVISEPDTLELVIGETYVDGLGDKYIVLVDDAPGDSNFPVIAMNVTDGYTRRFSGSGAYGYGKSKYDIVCKYVPKLKIEGYINLYHNQETGKSYTSSVYETEEKAKSGVTNMNRYVATLKIDAEKELK